MVNKKIDKYRYEDENGEVRYFINDEWEEAQNKWLETHDKKYLWGMYDGYLHAVKSCMVKALKGKMIPFFNEKAEDAVIYQMEYHVRHPERRIEDIMKWSSFLAMYALHSHIIKTGVNWDEMILTEDLEIEEGDIEDNDY